MDHNFQHITINHCKMIEYIAMQQEQCEHFKYILRKWKWLNGFGERKRSSANDRFSSYSIEHYTGYHKFELCSVLVPSVMAVMAVAYRITFDCEFPIRKKNTYCERVSILRCNVDASEKDRQREKLKMTEFSDKKCQSIFSIWCWVWNVLTDISQSI